MHYVAAREPGPPEVLALAETATPAPKPGEVLIEVAYAGVNRPDCIQRAGQLSAAARRVADHRARSRRHRRRAGRGRHRLAGRRSGLRADARAAATPSIARRRRRGACPIRTGCPRSRRRACRRTISPSGTTCSTASICRPGETVLIHGGSGGIGLAAIQLAHAIGARAITTVGSDDKAAFCKTIGADHAINYREQDFAVEVAAITGQARRRRHPRHRRRRLHREEPEMPGAGRPDGDHRVPAGQPRHRRLAPHHDEAADRHRLDLAREPGGEESRAGAARCATKSGRCSPRAS